MSVKYDKKARATIARGPVGSLVIPHRDSANRRQVIFEEDAVVFIPIVERAVIEAMATGNTDAEVAAMVDTMRGGVVGERTEALLQGRLEAAQPADRMAMALALTPTFDEHAYYDWTKRGGDPKIELYLGPRTVLDRRSRVQINNSFMRFTNSLPDDDPNKFVSMEKLREMARASEEEALGAVGDAAPAAATAQVQTIEAGKEPAVHQFRRIARELGGERAASRDWKRVMGTTRMYTHEASTSFGVAYGLGFFARAAHINHSCNPNAELVIIGSHAKLYACRPIRAGDEITISYINGLDGERLIERRSLLSDPNTYSFACVCTRCRFETSNAEFVRDVTERHRAAYAEIGTQGVDVMDQIRKCNSQNHMREMLSLLEQYRATVQPVLLRHGQQDVMRKIIGAAFNAVSFMFIHGNVDLIEPEAPPAAAAAEIPDVDAPPAATAETPDAEAPTVDSLTDAVAATTLEDAPSPDAQPKLKPGDKIGNPLQQFVDQYYDLIVWILAEMGRSLFFTRASSDRMLHGSMRQLVIRWATFGIGSATQIIGSLMPDALDADAAARLEFYRTDLRCRNADFLRRQYIIVLNAICDEYTTPTDDGSWVLYADRHSMTTTDDLCRSRAQPWQPRRVTETPAPVYESNGADDADESTIPPVLSAAAVEQ